MAAIRIVLVDESLPFRRSLAALLAQHAELQVVGQAASAEEALPLIAQLRPDLLLVEAVLPGASGYELTRRIKEERSAPRVILLSLSTFNGYQLAASAAGADGFLRKDEVFAGLIPAILRLGPAESPDPPPDG